MVAPNKVFGDKNVPALTTLSIVAKPSLRHERVSEERYKQEKIQVGKYDSA